MKRGVESLVRLPWPGPAMIRTRGGVLSAVKLLNAPYAGFGVLLCLMSPELPQKLQPPSWEAGGSRQWNQNRRSTFQAWRWLRTSLNEPESSCACPARPLLMPKLSGGADPQPSSVSHSGVAWSPRFLITARNRPISWRWRSRSRAYGCRAAASNLFLTPATE